MIIKDLGTLDTSHPLFIFGGPYGNFEATKAILAQASALSIPTSHIICTGDLAAYCANPEETSELIKKSEIHCIQGNCEQSLMNDNDDCNCGFESDSTCSLLSKQWFDYCQSKISQDIKDWYKTIPEQITFSYGGKKWRVIHGGLHQINEFIFKSTPDNEKLNQLQKSETDAIINGHSGLPFTQIIGGKCWHNSGGAGMPANDGTPRVWYSLIQQTNDGISIQHHALDYDHKTAKEKMDKAGLKNGYMDCLESGMWPSLDVLPEVEKKQTGIPLEETEIIWSSDK